jgi:hypothetical protein
MKRERYWRGILEKISAPSLRKIAGPHRDNYATYTLARLHKTARIGTWDYFDFETKIAWQYKSANDVQESVAASVHQRSAQRGEYLQEWL